MNAILNPMLSAPYYARASRDDQRPQMHEYRDSDYMNLFVADLTHNRLQASHEQAWFSANKLDGKPWPYLRQPIHRGYYVATSEISCDSKVRAAVAPDRVKQAWIMVTKYAQGLHAVAASPKQTKLLLQNRLAQAQQAGMAFPARAQVVEGAKGRKHTLIVGYLPLADIVNKESKEPLQTEQQITQSASDLGKKFAVTEHIPGHDEILWDGTDLPSRPGGTDEPPRLAALIQLLDENLGLGIANARLVDVVNADSEDLVDQAQINALGHWLDQVYFYQMPSNNRSNALRDQQNNLKTKGSRLIANLSPTIPAAMSQAGRDAITVLRTAMQTTPVPSNTPRSLPFDRIYDFTPQRIAEYTNPWKNYIDLLQPLANDLRSELNKLGNIVLAELSQLSNALDRFRTALQSCGLAARALDQQFASIDLHRKNSLLEWYTGVRYGPEDEDNQQKERLTEQLPQQQKLIVPGPWIGQGPSLINQRWRSLIETYIADWQASPQAGSLTQDDDQLYQITLFATVRNDDGCEYLLHSSPGDPFFIASHYETRLMPTYPIKMPTLRDLKKAIKGPAMIMPSDLADKVNRLKFPDGKVEKGGSSGGIRWITVFSLPIVTICAMIMLMLMINILNFIFRWIPFAILRIPFPK